MYLLGPVMMPLWHFFSHLLGGCHGLIWMLFFGHQWCVAALTCPCEDNYIDRYKILLESFQHCKLFLPFHPQTWLSYACMWACSKVVFCWVFFRCFRNMIILLSFLIWWQGISAFFSIFFSSLLFFFMIRAK